MNQELKTFFTSRSFRETVIVIFFAILLFIGLRISIQSYIVYGPSMQPNYWEDEWIIVNKLDYKFESPKTGDIIVFQPPIQSTKPFIKRIIGLPGDTVEIKNGAVTVYKADGSMVNMDEPYIFEPFFSNYNTGVIPANEYFVMGDNRNNSTDSRTGWLVSRDKIVGKAWISIWPPRLWGSAPTFRQPASATVTPAK